MKHTKELAYLRQLCCLGLPKETLLPEFLHAVKAVIPSGSNHFSAVNERLEASHTFTTIDSTEFLEMVSETNRSFWTPAKLLRASQWFSAHPVLTDGRIVDENYYKTFLYSTFKRFGIHLLVHSPVLIDGKPAGMLTTSRAISDKPFTAEEEKLWVYLTGYVAHALRSDKQSELLYGNSGHSGMMILNQDATILHASISAHWLLKLVEQAPTPHHPLPHKDSVMPKLAQLCKNLNLIFQNKHTQPPSFCHANGYGRFIFQAYWLEPQNREPGGLIGVAIEHQEPQALKILRGLRDLPLSPTQKEVALLLTQGMSHPEIGQRLHIKQTTVKDHIGRIFDKLNICSREELLPLLLAKSAANLHYH